MGRKSREKKERREKKKIISDTPQKSGEKTFIAGQDIKKILLPDEFTRKYPTDTLVVNPMNPDIPEDQKVVIDMQIEFGSEFVAEVRFKGAAVFIGENKNDKKCVYQIAVLQTDRTSPWRAKANFMTDPVFAGTDDLDKAKDAMVEEIKGNLVYQIRDRIKEALNRAKIDKAAGRPVSMPWYVRPVDEAKKIRSRFGLEGKK